MVEAERTTPGDFVNLTWQHSVNRMTLAWNGSLGIGQTGHPTEGEEQYPKGSWGGGASRAFSFSGETR